MKRLSSLRTTRAPMPSTPMVWSSRPELFCLRFPSKAAVVVFCSRRAALLGRLRNLHASGCIEHGFDDVVVAGAAADIAFELLADGGLVELAIMAVHDVDRRHDHARRAI